MHGTQGPLIGILGIIGCELRKGQTVGDDFEDIGVGSEFFGEALDVELVKACADAFRLTAAGAGIIMISSELPELLGMSDRILVMHRGRIHAEIAAADATEERVLSAALGLAS